MGDIRPPSGQSPSLPNTTAPTDTAPAATTAEAEQAAQQAEKPSDSLKPRGWGGIGKAWGAVKHSAEAACEKVSGAAHGALAKVATFIQQVRQVNAGTAVLLKHGLTNVAGARQFLVDGDASAIRKDLVKLYENKNPKGPNDSDELRQTMRELVDANLPVDKTPTGKRITNPKKLAENKSRNQELANTAYGTLLRGMSMRINPETNQPFVKVPGMAEPTPVKDRAKYVNEQLDKMFAFSDKKDAALEMLAQQNSALKDQLMAIPAYLSPEVKNGTVVTTEKDGTTVVSVKTDPEFTKLMATALKSSPDGRVPSWTQGNTFKFGLGEEELTASKDMIKAAIADPKKPPVTLNTWQIFGDDPNSKSNVGREMADLLIAAKKNGNSVTVLVNGPVAVRSIGDHGSQSLLNDLEKNGIPVVRYGSLQQGTGAGANAAIRPSDVNRNAVEPLWGSGNHGKRQQVGDNVQIRGQNLNGFYFHDTSGEKPQNQWLDGGAVMKGPISREGALTQNEINSNFVKTTLKNDPAVQERALKALNVPTPDVAAVPGGNFEGMLTSQIPGPKAYDSSVLGELAILAFAKGKVTASMPYNLPMFPLDKTAQDPMAHAIIERAKRGRDTDWLKNSGTSTDLPQMERVSAPYMNDIAKQVAAIGKGRLNVYEKKGSNARQAGDPANNFWGTLHFKGSYEEVPKDTPWPDKVGMVSMHSAQPHAEGLFEVEDLMIGIGGGAANQIAARFEPLKKTHFTEYSNGAPIPPSKVKFRSLFMDAYGGAPVTF